MKICSSCFFKFESTFNRVFLRLSSQIIWPARIFPVLLQKARFINFPAITCKQLSLFVVIIHFSSVDLEWCKPDSSFVFWKPRKQDRKHWNFKRDDSADWLMVVSSDLATHQAVREWPKGPSDCSKNCRQGQQLISFVLFTSLSPIIHHHLFCELPAPGVPAPSVPDSCGTVALARYEKFHQGGGHKLRGFS